MKKTTLIALICVALLFSIFSTLNGHCQETTITTAEMERKQEKKKKPLFWTFRNDSGYVNSFEAPNSIGLIEGGVIYNQSLIQANLETKKHAKYTFRIGVSLAVPKDRNFSNSFGAVELSATRKLRKFDISAVGSFYKSENFSYATVGGEISKTFLNKEHSSIKPFSNLSWYVPTESSNNFVKSGLVSKSGVEMNTEFRKIEMEFGGQFIADTGALLSGRRFSFKADAICLFPLLGLRVGPRIGYSHLFNQPHHFEGMEKNKIQYGFMFRVGK